LLSSGDKGGRRVDLGQDDIADDHPSEIRTGIIHIRRRWARGFVLWYKVAAAMALRRTL